MFYRKVLCKLAAKNINSVQVEQQFSLFPPPPPLLLPLSGSRVEIEYSADNPLFRSYSPQPAAQPVTSM